MDDACDAAHEFIAMMSLMGRNQSSAQAWEPTGYKGQKNAKFRKTKYPPCYFSTS
jgi:hypothetical protein